MWLSVTIVCNVSVAPYFDCETGTDQCSRIHIYFFGEPIVERIHHIIYDFFLYFKVTLTVTQTLHRLVSPLCLKKEEKNVTHDTWHMTRDKWHLTRDTWHMTHDMWRMTSGGMWTFSQNFSSLALVFDGDDDQTEAHGVILAAGSTFFQRVLGEKSTSHSHPMLFLAKVNQGHINHILDFLYNGQTKLPHGELPGVLLTAKSLGIKGLFI